MDEKKIATVSGTLTLPNGQTLAWQLRKIPAQDKWPEGIAFEATTLGRKPERVVQLRARARADLYATMIALAKTIENES